MGEIKLKRNRVWNANSEDLVCTKYKFSFFYLKYFLIHQKLTVDDSDAM